MSSNYKKFKYMYSLTAIAIASFFIFAIASPAYAVSPGASWTEYQVQITYANGATYSYHQLNRTYVYSNYDEIPNDTMRYFRQIKYILYEPLFEFDQPMAIFAFKNTNLVGDGSSKPLFYISGSSEEMYNIDTALSLSNNKVYYKTFQSGGYIRATMVFIPIDHFITYWSINSANYDWELPYMPMFFKTETGSSNLLYVLSDPFTVQYIGNIDIENDNIIPYIDDIESSLLSIDQKLDAIISILENQQSQQQASQSINSAEIVHNNIDQIQNNSGTALNNSFNSFLNNPDLTLNTSTISGASFLATLATSIFNNVGIFNWLFIFPAFIGLGTYLIGRGSKVLK